MITARSNELTYIKGRLKQAIPPRLRVRVKYWYSFLRGYFEPEMAILRQLIEPGDHVLDVGANQGVYAYHMARLGATVDMFEPNSSCHDALDSWAEGNPRITLHKTALSSHEGAAYLHIPVSNGGIEHDSSGSLEREPSNRCIRREVDVRKLDNFRFRDVAFIKVDVEGHESDFLAGGMETIQSARPAMLIEIERRHNAIPVFKTIELLCSWGYHGYFLNNGCWTSVRGFDEQLHQSASSRATGQQYINNFLFIHDQRRAEGKYPGLDRLGL